MWNAIVALSAIGCLVLNPGVAHAFAMTLAPTSDKEAWDADNDGFVDTLRAESYPPETLCCPNELHVANSASPTFEPGTSRAALEFDLGEPLPPPRIVSATLYLRVAAAYSLATEMNRFQIAVHSYAGDGVVSLADMHVNNPFIAATYWNDFFMAPSPEFNYTLAIDVTPALLALSPSDQVFGLMLEGVTPGGGFSFFSREEAMWPGPMLQIIVNTSVPEPGPLALFGLGIAALVLRRRLGAT